MSNRFSRSRRVAMTLSTMIGAPLLMPTGAQATPLHLKAFEHAVEVTEDALADMRGRFIDADELIFFGVEMYTEWQSGAGKMYSAGLTMNVDFSEATTQFRPTVTVVLLGGQAQESALQNGGQLATIDGGINNVKGIAQSIQVAGDTNRIDNDTRINIAIRTAEASSQGDNLGGVLLGAAGTTTLVSEEGAITAASIGVNSLGLSITLPEQGQVLQQIQGGGINSGSGVLQSAQVISDMNRIHNSLNLNIELNDNGAASVNLNPALLDSLRGLNLPGTL
jgi:hypothetical protein